MTEYYGMIQTAEMHLLITLRVDELFARIRRRRRRLYNLRAEK
jgi:hypothetical protein